MTPHINAEAGAFSDVCLLPGDPLRAKYIAETFLDDAVMITDVRNMYGYTGAYQGRKVSVMGVGMGIPSASIYYKELITEYGVSSLLRVGSCGAVSRDVQVKDLVLAMGACTDSKVNRVRFSGHDFAAVADFNLLEKAVESAKKHKFLIKIGNVFTTDLFYSPEYEKGFLDTLERYGVLGVEMEIAGLYGVCAEYGAKGMAICTVSDHIRTGDALSAKERQLTFDEMITVALEVVKKI
ncbi:Purine nucleoside phosphorylase DeoD-type [invertebrate metagenome]|uniref:Purine nucleoside phosphorylase DeoD-type n=1 Tax=invertebrate metagenome TaxID=1711999 RepID=A0A2H9T852_9ZZZZ